MRHVLADISEDHGGALVGGGLLLAALAAAAMLLGTRANIVTPALDKRTRCTASAPGQSTLLLVDSSHPLSAHNARQVRTLIEDGGRVARGTRFVLARISGAPDARPEVLFDMCSPGRAEEADALKEGSDALEVLWRRHYKQPLTDAIEQLVKEEGDGSAQSFLTAAVARAVADRSLHLEARERRVFLLSDLIENTVLSRPYHDGQVALPTPHAPFLAGIDVVFIELPAEPGGLALQTAQTRARWRAWAAAAGARSVSVEAPEEHS